MKSYAPYENVAPLDYPAILAMAGLNDTRVLYHEPAKWVARLRATLPRAPTRAAQDRDGRRPRRPQRPLRRLARGGVRARLDPRPGGPGGGKSDVADYTSSVERTGRYTYVGTASSGATVTMATKGTPGAFSPVELLLAALGGCAGFGVERFVTRRAGEPVRMEIELAGDLTGPQSNKLRQITVRYTVDTSDGPGP